MGSAAQVLGDTYDVFRPHGISDPLAPGNSIMRLPIILDGGDPGYRRPRGYERALRATFDAVNVAVGDYLRGGRGVLFVAALPLMLRPLVVLTTAVLDVLRPGAAPMSGLNPYGGLNEASVQPVLLGWPGQMVVESPSRNGTLPGDGGLADFSVLLPRTPVLIEGADLLQDEKGRRYVVRAAEATEMGWRLLVRQAGT